MVPTDVSVSTAVLTTDVHLKFAKKLEKRIKAFIVQVYSDSFRDQVTLEPCDRVATFSNLVSNTDYSASILAKYDDNFEAAGEICKFTTPGIIFS